MTPSRVIAAVEIGTSKVVCVVANVTAGQNISLLGRGEATSRGIRKGDIIDFRQACEAVHSALNMAEKSAGASIEAVYLSLSGRHIEGFFHIGTTAINTPNALVAEADIARVMDNAKAKALPEGRLYLHHIKNGFLLDGKFLENPLHHHGQKLEVAYWHLHADTRRVSEAMSVINRYGLPVDEIIASSVASANIATSENDRKLGCIVLDIGGGTTDYVVYRKGVLIRAGVIAIGGDHFTNDLSNGLRVNIHQAEILKKTHAKAMLQDGDKSEQRWLYGELMGGNSAIGNRPIKLSAFAQILQPRIEELFDILREELGELYDPNLLKAGVIFTGGSSRLPGLVELAQRRLALDAKTAAPVSWVSDAALRGPEFATVLGLLYSALTLPQRSNPAGAKSSILGKLSKLFSMT